MFKISVCKAYNKKKIAIDRVIYMYVYLLINHFSGFIIYFYYGIKNSTLELEAKSLPEQTITTPEDVPKIYAAVKQATDTTEKAQKTMLNESANPARPVTLDPSKTSNKSDLFISPSSFPKWDD